MPGHTFSTGVEDPDYDFIVVGAGSASCLIASRLSQQLPNHRILILEAGEHLQDDPRVQNPGLMTSLHSTVHDWAYSTAPEPGLNGRTIKHPRGKLVGGTSTINSHSVVFPNTEWHDRVAAELLLEAGREDWSAKGMEDCYKRWQFESPGAKKTDDLDRVQTSFPSALDVLQSQWIEAFEELGHATTTTGFAESSAGAVTVTNAIDASKAERSHAATAFLEPALKRGNVTLRSGVMVDTIAFDQGLTDDGMLSANGVRYKNQEQEYLATAREIIICAGVFESPALLERSGIGSSTVLEAANIPVRHHLPGVGENLQDHLNCGLSIETNDNIPTRDEAVRDPEERKAARHMYEQNRTGRMSEGPAHSFAFTPLQMLETPLETAELTSACSQILEKESNPSLAAQYSIIRAAIESPTEATATTFMLRSQRHRDLDSLPTGTPSSVAGNYVTVVAMLAHPFSRGTCHIISPQPSHPPAINFNYLSHPLDTLILSRHLRLIDRLFQQPSFKRITKPNGRRLPRSYPHPVSTLEQARGILPVNAATNYHPCGTCAMMREELGGVVDERLRVYGTRNLRVCDASTLR